MVEKNQAFYLLMCIFLLSGIGIYLWLVRRQGFWEVEREASSQKIIDAIRAKDQAEKELLGQNHRILNSGLHFQENPLQICKQISIKFYSTTFKKITSNKHMFAQLFSLSQMFPGQTIQAYFSCAVK
jgi:hypothetical protein